MQLYKERNFSALFNDSFKFLKQNFKHFYGGFIKIVGIPSLIFVLFSFILFQLLSSQLVSVNDFYYDGLSSFSYMFESILVGLVLFLIMMALGVITQLYTPLYFSMYEQNEKGFLTKDLWQAIKTNLGKAILYFLVIFLIIFVIGILLTSLIVGYSLLFNDISILVGIGIMLLLVVFMGLIVLIPYVTLSFQVGFFEYLNKKLGIIESIKMGFNLVKSNFWTNVGGFFLYSIIINMVVGLVVNVPFYIIMMSRMILGVDPTMESEFMQGLVSLYFWQYVVQILVSLLVSPILQVYVALIYYSNQEDVLQTNIYKELDEIGL